MKRTVSVLCVLMLLLSISAAAFADSAVDTIMTAGTTQAFTDEPVAEDDLQTILQAGLASESAINQQPWHFVVVSDKDVMKDLSGGGMPMGGARPEMPAGAVPGNGMPEGMPEGGPAMPDGKNMPAAPMAAGGAKAALGDSPIAILVYMDLGTPSPDPSFDCGLAVQNMYIAANSLGYGAKVISSPTMVLNGERHDDICTEFGLDTSLQAVAVLLIGKADESVDASSGQAFVPILTARSQGSDNPEEKQNTAIGQEVALDHDDG